jgi:hypothetical protein
MIDRTTKILLALIAAGLWANVVAPLAKVAPALAQSPNYLARIDDNINDLARGRCINTKLC